MITNRRRNRNDSHSHQVKSPPTSLLHFTLILFFFVLFCLFLNLYKVEGFVPTHVRVDDIFFHLQLLLLNSCACVWACEKGMIYLFFPLFCLACGPPLGGVMGRPVFNPPYGNFFLSAGLRIWKEHMSVSSTDIMAPALSNSPQ